jgi:hypothetical protein
MVVSDHGFRRISGSRLEKLLYGGAAVVSETVMPRTTSGDVVPRECWNRAYYQVCSSRPSSFIYSILVDVFLFGRFAQQARRGGRLRSPDPVPYSSRAVVDQTGAPPRASDLDSRLPSLLLTPQSRQYHLVLRRAQRQRSQHIASAQHGATGDKRPSGDLYVRRTL